MIRTLCAVAVVAACRREPAPAPVAHHDDPPVVAPAAVADAPAPVEVDLLHAVTATVAVSSVVANPAYSPFDLVDGDPATAWNSKTGDAHAWIAVRVPAAATIAKVRMIAGFAGKGPEGDYFTMNPRIRHVRVTHAGDVVRDHDLDPDQRGLQDIPLGVAGGDYKLEIVSTVPGTRKDWREIVVSELEVIGTPPPGTRPGEDLTITIGSLDGKPLEDDALTWAALPEQGAQTATDGPPLPTALPKGWTRMYWAKADAHATCRLAIEANAHVYVIDENDGEDCGKVEVHDRWLAVTTTTMTPATDTLPARYEEQLRVCGTNADGDPACTSPFHMSSTTERAYGGGTAGADGLAIDQTIEWRLGYKLDHGVLTIIKDRGNAPDYVRDQLGRHRLPR